MTLYASSFVLLSSSVALFGQSVTETEKWFAPIILGVTNLMGSIFAFLTAREMRLNDADKKIVNADLRRALDDNEECKQDRERIKKRLNKLWNRVYGDTEQPEDDDEIPPVLPPPTKKPKGPRPGSDVHRVPKEKT